MHKAAKQHAHRQGPAEAPPARAPGPTRAAPAPVAPLSAIGNQAAQSMLNNGFGPPARLFQGAPAEDEAQARWVAADCRNKFALHEGPLRQAAADGRGERRFADAARPGPPWGASGAMLPAGLRSEFEERFNTDFSSVRIHDNASAAYLADRARANAFTLADDIVFADGRYAPQTARGRGLLAHELTHVMQQRLSGRACIQREVPSAPGPAAPTPIVPERLSNQDLIAEIAAAQSWLAGHLESSVERDQKLADREALFAERERRVAAGHAWLTRTEGQTPAQLYQLVTTPDGLLVVQVTDPRVMSAPGGLPLSGSRIVTREQLDAIQSSTGGAGGPTPAGGTATAAGDPIAGALDTAFGGETEAPYEAGTRRPGMVRIISPDTRVVLSPYTIMHPAEVPAPFGGSIMDMAVGTAAQIHHPGIDYYEAGQLERARGPNAGEVTVRQMGQWAANAPETRILLARVGNDLVFVGYDTSRYHPSIVSEGYVEAQPGSGGVGQALLADRVLRSLQRNVPQMLVEVGLSEGTERFHQRIYDAIGRSETAATGDHYALDTRQMVQVLLEFNDRIPAPQRARLQGLIAAEGSPTPEAVRAVVVEIPEPRAVPMPGGGGYLRSFGVGAGLGMLIPTVVEGGQLLYAGEGLTSEQAWHLGTTAGLGFGSGGAGALAEQGFLNALGPNLSRSLVPRAVGGGIGFGVAAPIFVGGQMYFSGQHYESEEYAGRMGRAATSGVLAGALSAGLVAAIWGSEVPILGNIVGFIVGFVGYLAVDALIGEDVERYIRDEWRRARYELREMGEAVSWAAERSPGSFFAPGIVTPFAARGGLGSLVRSPLDVMRESQPPRR